jgi:hypothetical protein
MAVLQTFKLGMTLAPIRVIQSRFLALDVYQRILRPYKVDFIVVVRS